MNTIYIYGDIGEDWWSPEESITDKTITDQLAAFGNSQDVDVRINSMGGATHHGVAIYNILSNYATKMKAINPDFSLNTVVDGFAYSAASIIMLAGDKRIMNLGSRAMIHNPWMYAMGDAREMQKAAEYLDKAKSSSATMYAAITGKKEDVVSKLMDDETYFSASEAVDFGLATEAPNKKGESSRSNPYETCLAQIDSSLKLHGNYVKTMLLSRGRSQQRNNPSPQEDKSSVDKTKKYHERLRRDLELLTLETEV